MKNLISYISVILICCLFSNFTYGQDILKTDGKAIVNQAGDTIVFRGMGLGGWMIQEGYMLQ